MSAGESESLADFYLAAGVVARTSEKPRRGFAMPTAVLHRGFSVANSITATGLDAFAYDFCRGPRIRTYNRDSFTGLDYADQRFYASTYGRFNTPDPSNKNVNPVDPRSWNNYAYVNGEPININDPSGLGFFSTFWGGVRAWLFGERDGTEVVTSISYGERFEPVPEPMQNKEEAPPLLSPCDLVPDGRTLGLNAALGIIGGASGSAEIVFDYHTSQATLIFSGGLAATGAGAQAGASGGFIWGAGDSTPNYASGGNSAVGVSIPSGLGVSISTNSGGMTGNPLQLDPKSATSAQLTYTAGLVSLFGGVSIGAQTTFKSVSLGNFVTGGASILAQDFDFALLAIQSQCSK